MTFWELPSAPEEWRENLVGIDEIWAPNEFVAKAFGSIFNGPILVMPPAIQSSGDEHPGRAFYGMDESRFYFTFSFDYCSSPFRKNPFGVIEAFLNAFPTGQDNVGLVVKSMGAPELYPNLRAAIRDATNGDPRIMLIDEELPREQVLGLIRACDAYVSLHRAEGFGLGMVEAMSFGRIVIGTDYSGCTDFLTRVIRCLMRFVRFCRTNIPMPRVRSGPSPTSMPQLISCATSSPIPRNRAVARWLVDRSSGSATALRLLGG
jgi:glycosyltransferase involved in cell wall biosynthesis